MVKVVSRARMEELATENFNYELHQVENKTLGEYITVERMKLFDENRSFLTLQYVDNTKGAFRAINYYSLPDVEIKLKEKQSVLKQFLELISELACIDGKNTKSEIKDIADVLQRNFERM